MTARFHWVLAEAVSAAHVLGRPEDAQRWQQLAEQRFLDPSTGNLHHETTADGRPATVTWTGQPDAYHVYQSRLLSRLPLRGSLAESLQAHRAGSNAP